MKRKVSLLLTLIALIILSVSLQTYAADEQLHVYYKYSVKTWWDRSDTKGNFQSVTIYKNELIKQSMPGSLGGASAYDNPYSYQYTSYEIVPVMVMGQPSYKLKGENVDLIEKKGQTFLHIFDEFYIKSTVNSIAKETGWYKPWVMRYSTIEAYDLKINYYYNECKGKDVFISEVIASKGTYPSNGLHTDGYWYIDRGVLNKIPSINITQPITNQRIGNQDNLIINGTVRDEDVGDTLSIKYLINKAAAYNVTLTQPVSLVSNGQVQSFQGYIKLSGLSSGDNKLNLWVEDSKGGKSNVVEVPIVVFSTLENILNSLKSYSYKSGDPQLLVVNSNTRIAQNAENDRLISSIRTELSNKNVRLFFIGQDKETEQYIKSKLSLN